MFQYKNVHLMRQNDDVLTSVSLQIRVLVMVMGKAVSCFLEE